MAIATKHTTIAELFENRDNIMFPSDNRKFLYFAREDKPYRSHYLDITDRLENGRYRAQRDDTKYSSWSVLGTTRIIVYFEYNDSKEIVRDKLETFEQLVARIAPPKTGNLASRYDITGNRQKIGAFAGVFGL